MTQRFSFLLQCLTFALGSLLISSAYANTQSLSSIEKRIAPVGKVCLVGEECKAQPETKKVVQVAENTDNYAGRAPEKIYNTYCIACHASGAAGAPRVGHADEWAPHIAKGMDTLLKDAISGIGAMPPRGICSNCTDDELKHTIQYMIDKSK